jgi:hypothetical protein
MGAQGRTDMVSPPPFDSYPYSSQYGQNGWSGNNMTSGYQGYNDPRAYSHTAQQWSSSGPNSAPAMSSGQPQWGQGTNPSYPAGWNAQPTHTSAHRSHPMPSNPAYGGQSGPYSNTRRGSVDSGLGTKICSHCSATSTPLWRRDPNTMKPLCNACGLYLQQRGQHRPQELIDADIDDGSSDDTSPGDGTGPECSHCHTRNTSVWRRNPDGQQVCNACGVYQRLRGVPRPLSLKRNKIKPRTKHSTPGMHSPRDSS